MNAVCCAVCLGFAQVDDEDGREFGDPRVCNDSPWDFCNSALVLSRRCLLRLVVRYPRICFVILCTHGGVHEGVVFRSIFCA